MDTYLTTSTDYIHFVLLLLCGHLVGDFFLQRSTLIRWKERSLIGISVHVGILFLTTLCFMFPYLLFNDAERGTLTILLGIVIIHALHFLIDYVKIRLSKKFVQKSVELFILDQFCHVLVVLVVAYLYRNSINVTLPVNLVTDLYVSDLTIMFIFTLLLVTYPWEVAKFVFASTTVKSKRIPLEFKPDLQKMLMRGTVVGALFALFVPFVSFGASYNTERTARIDSISPTVMEFGQEVTVYGNGFGDEKNQYTQVCWGNFCINGESILVWSNTAITFKMNVLGMPSQGILHVVKLHPSGLYTENVTGTNVAIAPSINGFYDARGHKLNTLVAGEKVTIKGYYLGNTVGTIKLDTTNVTEITSWAHDSVEFTVPELKKPTTTLSLKRNNSLTTTLDIRTEMGISNDEYSHVQSYLFDINAKKAWELAPKLGEGVIVAVIDDGVDASHPDIAHAIFTNTGEVAGDGLDNDKNGFVDDIHGYNFYEINAVMTPKGDHGTIVAGVIAAKKDNKIGIAGIAPNAKILPLIACNSTTCSSSAVDKAVRYAVDMGAKVINLSLTGFGDAPKFEINYNTMMKYAADHGVIVVVASGNGNQSLAKAQEFYGRNFNEAPISPVCNDGGENFVVGVASIRSDLSNSRFSDYGSNCIDVSAYGENVYSLGMKEYATDGLPYASASGTSFATPQVSGALALALAEYPGLSLPQYKNVLISSGRPLSEALQEKFRGHFGKGLDIYGFLNALSSVETASAEVEEVDVVPEPEVEVGQSGVEFGDLATTHRNYRAIQHLREKSVLSGYSDNTFRPSTTVNRAELLKILVAGEGITPDQLLYKDCFKDVSEEWFASYVCYAKEKGWVEGYSDGTFRPSEEVNKVEALKMMFEVYDIHLEDAGNGLYTDVGLDKWFSQYVSTARALNLLEEKGTLFHPSRVKTRASIAENVYRIVKMRASGRGVYSE